MMHGNRSTCSLFEIVTVLVESQITYLIAKLLLVQNIVASPSEKYAARFIGRKPIKAYEAMKKATDG